MMKNYALYLLWFCLLVIFSVSKSQASHIMAADLTYEHLGGLQYRLTLTQYRDCSGITSPSSASVTISSLSCNQTQYITANLETGFPTEVSAICPAQLSSTSCSGGTLPGVQEYRYSAIVTLPMACTDWVFSWYDCCRNSAINTINFPDGAGIYVEATLNNVAFPANNSPSFTTKPVPYFGLNQAQNYSHSTTEPDGDLLVYSLISPMDNATTPVSFIAPYSATYPCSTVGSVFNFNTTTGQMSFTPNAVQRAVTAVLVQEYRNGVLIGSVRRDIQMVVLNVANGSTTASTPANLVGATLVPGQTSVFSACVGTPMSFQVTASDPNPVTVITHSSNNTAAIPGSTVTGTGNNPRTVTFNWNPTVANIGSNNFTLTFTDNACPIPSIVTYNFVIFVLGINITNNDTFVCNLGNSLQLNTSIFGGGGGTYAWTGQGLSATNIANPSVTPSSLPAVYNVSYTLTGCTTTDQVTILPGNVTVNAFSVDSVLCVSKPITLNSTVNGVQGGTYTWTGAGLSATNAASVSATPPALPQTYSLTYTTPSGGCTATDAVQVTLSANMPVSATAAPSNICIGGGPVQLTAAPAPPSSPNYTLSSIPYQLTAGSGTNLALSDDQLSAALPIGFTFNFYGTNYTNFYVSSNGFISFDAAAGSGCCSGQVLPNTTTPNNLIALVWSDLYPPGAGSIDYFTTGVAPNRKLVVNYTNIPRCCNNTPAISGQIVLFENGNVIEIHQSSVVAGGTSTLGIENAAGSAGTSPAGRNAATWALTNESWRFTPSISYTYVWSPSTNLSSTTVYNPVISTLTSDTVYTVTVTSSEGCSGTGSVTINTSSALSNIATATATPNSACAGSSGSIQLAASPVSVTTYNGNGPYSVVSIPFSSVLGAGTNVTLGDDQVSAALPVGFNFTFYGNTYTNFYISSNGFITFDAAAGSGCCNGQALPNTATPNNLIALAWADLYPPGGGSISYFTTGTAPNRRLVVNYTNIPRCCNSTAAVTGQIVLYEGTNIIELFVTSVASNGSSNTTMGIENLSGTLATTVTGRNSTLWSAANEGWRFYSGAAASYAYNWSPATNLSATNIYNPLVSAVNSTITYNCQITEVATGCIVNKPVTITYNAPVTPTVAASITSCSSTTLNVTSSQMGTIQWFTNSTGSGTPAGTGMSFTPSSNGTYYAFENLNGCLSPASNATVVSNVGGTSWTNIPAPVPPVSVPQSYYANAYCYDNISGLYHYFNTNTQTLILSTQYGPPAGVNLVSYPPTNNNEMCVKVDVLPGYGSGTGTFVAYGLAPYVTNPLGWYVMHRTWNILVPPIHQIPSGSTQRIRFYFNMTDENDVANVTGKPLSTFWFYKMITALDPSNPADHLGVTTPQINLYTNGATPSLANWALGIEPVTGAYYADYDVNSFSGGGGGSGVGLPSGPLPIELLSFTGESIDRKNHLRWRVQEEGDALRYELQRSNSPVDFSFLGQLQATGKSNYTFVDDNPLIGRNYYRLKFVHTDGSFGFSNVLALDNYPDGFQYQISPNPAHNEIHLQVEGATESHLLFMLYNQLGQLVLQRDWNENGTFSKDLDISQLANGVYLYKITDNRSVYSGKLIKGE